MFISNGNAEISCCPVQSPRIANPPFFSPYTSAHSFDGYMNKRNNQTGKFPHLDVTYIPSSKFAQPRNLDISTFVGKNSR